MSGVSTETESRLAAKGLRWSELGGMGFPPVGMETVMTVITANHNECI